MPHRPYVLIVDDHLDVLQTTAQLLWLNGFKVLTAVDAFKAMEALMGNPDVACVFTDIRLPRGMNGMQLARTVREFASDIRIVLGSAYDLKTISAMPGFDPDYRILPKPYSESQLFEALNYKRDPHA